MAKKGQNVGRVYVSGHVNGDSMNDEIVDAVKDAGPEVEREGDAQGKRFGGRMGERIRERLEEYAPRISRALDEKMDSEGIGARAGDGAGKSFVRRMSERSKAIGNKVGSALGDDIGENIADRLEMAFAGMLDDLEDRIETLTKRAGSGRANTKGGTTEDYGPPPVAQRRLEQAYRMDREFDKARHLMIERAYKMNFEFDKRRHRMLEEAYRMNARFDAGGLTGDGRTQRLPRRDNDVDFDMPGRIGSLFGAGSRNNFLNVLGKSMTNVLRLTESVRKGASSMFGTFMEGFNGAQQGASFLQKALGGVGAVGSRASAGASKMFSSLAASGPAAAVAIAAVLVLLSAMASMLGALIGIVTALTATIVSGLVGALTVAGGALMAVVAAGGLLTAAFMSMTNAQQTMLKDAFNPLRDQMTGLGQIMMEQMVGVFPVWSANLQRALALAGPLASVMGQAFANAGTILTNSLAGPGFQKLFQTLAVWLPGIVTNLSGAFGNFLNGVAGMFSAILPHIAQFALYLQNVASRFSTWANSAGGQNAIVSFVDRAVESLQHLWGFVTSFFGFLGDILFSAEAQAAGNSMFDSMRDAFERFRAAISSGDLERWFQDAIQFGGALWGVMQSLADVFFALYESGTIDGIAAALGWMAGVISDVAALLEPLIWLVGKAGEMFGSFNSVLGGVPGMLAGLLGPLGAVLGQLQRAADLVRWAKQLLGQGDGGSYSPGSIVSDFVGNVNSSVQREIRSRQKNSAPGGKDWGQYMRDTGNSARQKTYQSSGGYMPSPSSGSSGGYKAPAKYVNPYEDWANSLIKQGPKMTTEIRLAVRELRREAYKAIIAESKSKDHAGLAANLLGNVNDMRKQGADMVKRAQEGLNSAARALANASSPEEAKKALRDVQKAQADLRYAQKQQKRLDKAATIINKQRYASKADAQKLLRGEKVRDATLATYALARESLAIKIEDANQKLADAIAMRDDYKKAVIDAAKAFASLTGAQAQMVDGVQQALTAGDITSHLRDRLDKMRQFQADLKTLLALGLSNEAYKQIVDAGVDGGADYAKALIEGGIGAVRDVNNLTQQIGSVADALGKDTSDRLYQAGVNAAQGLVDGLMKLDKQLEQAAANLGKKIAEQVKKTLGIKSPSRVAIGLMGDFGDGLENGLDAQHVKVSRAAGDLADLIALRPGGPTLGEIKVGSGANGSVSGNPKIAGDVSLTVVTPTKDPVAAAKEAINELVGVL